MATMAESGAVLTGAEEKGLTSIVNHGVSQPSVNWIAINGQHNMFACLSLPLFCVAVHVALIV